MKHIKVNIGTSNPTKISAVKDAFALYEEFNNAVFEPIKTDSGVSDQPKSLSETIKGAKNRSKSAYTNCTYSVGLESGLFKVKGTNTGYMDVCVAVIYDGKKYYMGFGPALEFPKSVINDVTKHDMNSTDSFYKQGLTKKKNIGYEEGILGVLTRGRMPRKEYHKYSVMMALVQIINKKLYE